MQRINTSTKAADLHGPGKPGFRPGDPNAGVLPTQLSADWFNDFQESVCRVVEGSGRTLGAAGHDDLYLAIGAIVANAVQAAANPTGKLAMFAHTAAPAGWLILRGNTIGDASSGANERAHADTQALFVHLWTTFPDRPLFESNGTPASRGASALADFNAHKRLTLWNSQDEFWRSAGPGRTVGTWQADEVKEHAHKIYGQDNGAGPSGATSNEVANIENPGAGFDTYPTPRNTSSVGGAETRPRNLAWLPCIKL